MFAKPEIIAMTGLMNLIFEVADLAVASQRQYRCGMVYMEPAEVGWKPQFKSWVSEGRKMYGDEAPLAYRCYLNVSSGVGGESQRVEEDLPGG